MNTLQKQNWRQANKRKAKLQSKRDTKSRKLRLKAATIYDLNTIRIEKLQSLQVSKNREQFDREFAKFEETQQGYIAWQGKTKTSTNSTTSTPSEFQT